MMQNNFSVISLIMGRIINVDPVIRLILFMDGINGFILEEATLGSSESSFSSHVNYVPFTRDFDDKQFCQVVTLAFSELDELTRTLRPGYGIITYEMVNEDIYIIE